MKMPPLWIIIGDDVVGISSTIKAEYSGASIKTCLEFSSVDEVRDLISKAYLLSENTVFVITDAHKLTAAAQNALLKLAEEPPEKCCLVLVANDLKKLLPTLQSRARISQGLFIREDIVFEQSVKELAVKLRDNLHRVNPVNLLSVLSHLSPEQLDSFLNYLGDCWAEKPELFSELCAISSYRNSFKPGTNLSRHLTDLFFALWEIRNGGPK